MLLACLARPDLPGAGCVKSTVGSYKLTAAADQGDYVLGDADQDAAVGCD